MQFDEGLLFINIYIFTYSLNTLYKFLPIPYVRPSARTSDQLPMTLHRLNNKYPMIALNAFPIETLLFTFLHFGMFCLINLFCFFFHSFSLTDCILFQGMVVVLCCVGRFVFLFFLHFAHTSAHRLLYYSLRVISLTLSSVRQRSMTFSLLLLCCCN